MFAIRLQGLNMVGMKPREQLVYSAAQKSWKGIFRTIEIAGAQRLWAAYNIKKMKINLGLHHYLEIL